jgi:hypothetical protein
MNVGFAVGSGRCGTLFLHEVVQREPGVASSHERNPDNEAFHRYCKWHNLPVDDEGFLATKEHEIRTDLAERAFSFEASPYLSLSVGELHERFGAKFIFLVRRPDEVVSSFAHKGFYREPYLVRDPDLAAGYQREAARKPFMFFARISPRGEAFRAWNAMTQIGKVAWFWRAYNERSLQALARLPEESYRLVRIEDVDHAEYVALCRFLGFESRTTEAEFEALRTSKPHSNRGKRTVEQWTEQEIAEFESEVGELAARFDYPHRVADLVEQARARKAAGVHGTHSAPPRSAPRFWRARQATAKWLRGLATSVDPT